MEKLELKHLSPYLPYNLKIKVNRGIDTMQSLEDCIVNYGSEDYYGYGDCESQFKPILRPLSDLTKEIDGVVHLVEIYKMMWASPSLGDYSIEGGVLKFRNKTFEYDEERHGFRLDGENAFIYLEVADFLDKHHYDWRYGLIDCDLAVSSNSL